MQYRNSKTGVVMDFKSPISGTFWEPVEAPGKPEEKGKSDIKPRGRKAVKNGGKNKA